MTQETNQETSENEEETCDVCPRCNGTGQMIRGRYAKRAGDLARIREIIRREGTITGRELNRRIREMTGVNAVLARNLSKRAVNGSEHIRRIDGRLYWIGEA